jgi:hypothetical protein
MVILFLLWDDSTLAFHASRNSPTTRIATPRRMSLANVASMVRTTASPDIFSGRRVLSITGR